MPTAPTPPPACAERGGSPAPGHGHREGGRPSTTHATRSAAGRRSLPSQRAGRAGRVGGECGAGRRQGGHRRRDPPLRPPLVRRGVRRGVRDLASRRATRRGASRGWKRRGAPGWRERDGVAQGGRRSDAEVAWVLPIRVRTTKAPEARVASPPSHTQSPNKSNHHPRRNQGLPSDIIWRVVALHFFRVYALLLGIQRW